MVITIVIGSDQIWNYSFKSFSDKALAAFAPSYKKKSLSASFGIDYVPEENTETYNICQKGLNDIKAISVREEAGKEIINKITNRNDVEVLVDPTMLIETEQWEKLIKKPENLKTDKFILKSFLGNVSDEIWNELITFAKKYISKFNMKNRIFNGKISNEILNNDFSQVNEILKQEQKKQMNF